MPRACRHGWGRLHRRGGLVQDRKGGSGNRSRIASIRARTGSKSVSRRYHSMKRGLARRAYFSCSAAEANLLGIRSGGHGQDHGLGIMGPATMLIELKAARDHLVDDLQGFGDPPVTREAFGRVVEDEEICSGIPRGNRSGQDDPGRGRNRSPASLKRCSSSACTARMMRALRWSGSRARILSTSSAAIAVRPPPGCSMARTARASSSSAPTSLAPSRGLGESFVCPHDRK